MNINFIALEKMGFHCELHEDEGVCIYPRNPQNIISQLQELTELPRRDCEMLMEDISDLQIINAIKTA
jgi:hypothetical protein